VTPKQQQKQTSESAEQSQSSGLEPLKQTPQPPEAGHVGYSSDLTAEKKSSSTPAVDELTRPVGATTVEPVAGSEGPRSQLEIDQQAG
jgi:hypothetical protein